MRPKAIHCCLAMVGLVACSELSPEPDTATPLTSIASPHAIRTEHITIRAALVAYASFKEFEGAKCTFTRGRQTLEVTTPQKVSVEITPGEQADITLECEQLIGGRVRQSFDRFEPNIKVVTKGLPDKERVYPDRINALFLQR